MSLSNLSLSQAGGGRPPCFVLSYIRRAWHANASRGNVPTRQADACCYVFRAKFSRIPTSLVRQFVTMMTSDSPPIDASLNPADWLLMSSWLLRQIGIEGAFLERWSDAHIAFQNEDYLSIGLPLVALAGVWIWLRQKQHLPSAGPQLRLALTLCRVIVLTLLVVVLANPYARLELKTENRPIVALLLDHSHSMNLAAGPFADTELRPLVERAGLASTSVTIPPEVRADFNRKSRGQLAVDLLRAQQSALLEPLRDNFEVRLYTFGREATLQAFDPTRPEFPDPPRRGDGGSHIGSAITQILNEAEGKPVAGIILVSDGENTGGRPPLESALDCGTLRTTLLAVPVGAAQRLKDVAIVDVSTSGQVAKGDTAKVAVVLQSTGYEGKPVKVVLKDGGNVLDTKELTLRGGEQQQVELTFVTSTAGPRYLTVEVPPLPDEDLKENNTDVAFLRITEEKWKVLYLEGLPRWDFRFLKNAMRRDPGLIGRAQGSTAIDVILEAEWRRLPSAEQAKALPQTLEELAAYHTIILGDVSPKLLTPEFVQRLAQAVREKGVGLVVQPGPQYMPHAYDRTLTDLLPVQLQNQRDVEPGRGGFFADTAKPYTIELAPDGVRHEAMRLYDDERRNRNVWQQMLPYQWCVAALRPTPAAVVLAWNPAVTSRFGKVPLLVHHQAGEGRVFLVGTDSTFLWRQNVADRFFYKFWGQVIRFVARPDAASKRKSWLEVQPVRPLAGEPVRAVLMAYDAQGKPLDVPELKIRLSGSGFAEPVERIVTRDGNLAGRYIGSFELPAIGDYTFSYRPEGLDPAEARVRVQMAPEELRYPNVNREAMKQWVAVAKGNSKLIELSDLAEIPSLLRGEKQIKTQPPQDRTLWDNWLLLGVLVLVYSLDVGLRRLTGLS